MIIQFFQFLKYHMFCEMKKKFLWFIWFASSSEDANIEPQVTLQEAAVRPQSRTSPQGTHLNPTEVNFAKALTSNSVKPRVNTKRGKKLHKDNPANLTVINCEGSAPVGSTSMLTEAAPVNEAAPSDPEVTLSEEAVQGC